jgi:hypothetical protein
MFGNCEHLKIDNDSSLDIFKRQVQAGLKCLAEQYHSPGKYLEAVLRDPLDVNKFAEHLIRTTPATTTKNEWNPRVKRIGPTHSRRVCIWSALVLRRGAV